MKRKNSGMEFSLVLDENTIPVIEQLSESMPGGFFMYHAESDGELIYFNSALLRIFGCDTNEEFKELTGNTFRGMVHPEDIDGVEKSIAGQIANSVHDMDYVEYRIIQKNGDVRWVEDYGHFMSTKIYGDIFCVFIEDATERLKSRMTDLEEVNNELRNAYARESQYRMAILYEADSFFEINLTKDTFIPTAVQMRDEQIYDLFKIEGNHGFDKYSDYIDYLAECTKDSDLAEYINYFRIEHLMRCYDKGELEKTFYSWVTDRYGRKHLYHLIFLLGKNEYSGDIAALFIAKDVTDQAEKHRMLKSALRQAESANLARNAFLSNMSHDIRTPLNAIIGYTELVKNHIAEQDKVQDYIRKIRMSGEQLLSILDESMEITRMESGRVSITESECHLVDLLAEVEKTMLSVMKTKSINFTVNKSAVQHFSIFADAIRVKEILCKLLDNAAKYTQKNGNVSLTVVEKKLDFSGYGRYQFIVEDNGIGISEDFMEVLFDPFKRENNTTQSGVSGTGLGLTMVKNLVELMEGEIAVESEKGKGSKFTVTLLLRHQEEQDSYARTMLGPLIKREALKGKRILLVEDNEINCEIAQELLQSQGYIVEIARNGSIAVEMLRNSVPGYYLLILMDIQMPVMDGYEATQVIRKLENPALANVPIIALSANAFVEDYHKSVQVGMDAHFPKPIDINNLQLLIQNVLSGHR